MAMAYSVAIVARERHSLSGVPVVPLVCSLNMRRVSQSSARKALGLALTVSLSTNGQLSSTCHDVWFPARRCASQYLR